jgi:hypothetical protein
MKMKAEFINGGFYGLFYQIPSIDDFEQAEAKVKVKELKGTKANAHVVFYPENADEGWYIVFYISRNEKGEGVANCNVQIPSKPAPFKPIIVDLKEWHTLTFRYDKKKTTFSFYVDNQFLGSANIASALEKTAPDSTYAFSIQVSGMMEKLRKRNMIMLLSGHQRKKRPTYRHHQHLFLLLFLWIFPLASKFQVFGGDESIYL